MSASKQTYQQELRVVGILILVYHDVAEAVTIFFQNIWELLEQFYGKDDDIVKVQCICCFQAFLIKVVNFCDNFFLVVTCCVAQNILWGKHLVLCGTDRC